MGKFGLFILYVLTSSVLSFANDLNLVIYAEVTTTDEPASQLHLYWNSIPSAVEYEIWSDTYSDGAFILRESTSDTEYVDSSLDSSRFYFVKAFDSGESLLKASTKVGYFKIDVLAADPGSYTVTYFGFPGLKYFHLPSTNIPVYGATFSRVCSEILDEQAKCGSFVSAHRVVHPQSGTQAYRSSTSSCDWTAPDTLISKYVIDNGLAYVNRSTNARHILIAGEVNSTYTYVDSLVVTAGYSGGGWSYVGFPILKPTIIANLGLVSDGFVGGSSEGTSDLLVEINTDSVAWLDTTATPDSWQGLTHVKPGQLYKIFNRVAGEWYYTWP